VVRRTFEEAAAHYVELHEKKLSIRDEIAWLKELMPFVGNLPLDRIYDATLKPFVEAQRTKPVRAGRFIVRHGVKSKTINLKLGLVRHILRLASRSWRDEEGSTWLPSAPLITMVEGGDEREARQLTWQEQRDHLRNLPQHLSRMALFNLQCGVREEVICGLRWEWEVLIPELDIVTFVVPPDLVKGQKGKKRSRVLVCNSIARSIVESVREDHPEFVFVYKPNRDRTQWKGLSRPNHEPKPPRPIQTMNNTAWQNWRAKSGLGDLHVHDLRHTVGMRLREAGVAEETRADILWHRRQGMPQHYAVAQIVEIYGALEKITDERHGYNKSLASIAREQASVPTKVPAKKNAA
jgi:integrase